MPQEEIFDIVDENNQIIGQAPRSEIPTHKHNFRICVVIIETTDNKIVLQKRSLQKSHLPGLMSFSAGGLVSSGESYEIAARRETKEEIGIEVEELISIGQVKIDHDGHFSHNEIFIARYEKDDFVHDEKEVESLHIHTLEEVLEMHKTEPDKFMYSFKHNLEKYLEYKNNNS